VPASPELPPGSDVPLAVITMGQLLLVAYLPTGLRTWAMVILLADKLRHPTQLLSLLALLTLLMGRRRK
jgi:hypothetical protein